MKNIQPRAELPLVHMPHITNAMPLRNPPSGARNMTGLYLGMEGQTSPRSKNVSIPPLTRGRARGTIVRRPQTPTEQRRYRMIELHRLKDERKGFTGLPLKKRTSQGDNQENHQPPQPQPRGPTPRSTHVAVLNMTRQTPRNFTAANNSGMTHLEFLNQPIEGSTAYRDQDAFTVPLTHTVAKEVHRVAMTHKDLEGLVECYKKVCKGNMEALRNLLPVKSYQEGKQPLANYRQTGFSVKSYRNPKQAEILAEFPEPEPRAKTVLGAYRRPLVPNPYFFKNYNPPRTAALHTVQPLYSDNFEEGSSKPRGKSGKSGAKSVSQDQPDQEAADSPKNSIPFAEGQRNTAQSTSNSRPGEEEAGQEQPSSQDTVSENKVQISVPGVEGAAAASAGGPQGMETQAVPQAEASKTSEAADQEDKDSTSEMMEGRTGRRPSGVDIVICVGDEQGQELPVEIDDIEGEEAIVENNQGSPEHSDVEERPATPPQSPKQNNRRRVSITERVLKNRNAEMQMASIVEDAESRRRELQDLLIEHAKIVQEVTTMEGIVETPGSDKENETFSPPPPGGGADQENN